MEHDEANARRIVACVNACAGIPTEMLEGSLLKTFPDTIAQRDELAEALTTLLNAVEGNHVTQGDCNQARAALAHHDLFRRQPAEGGDAHHLPDVEVGELTEKGHRLDGVVFLVVAFLIGLLIFGNNHL